jgi:hypothetical protein
MLNYQLSIQEKENKNRLKTMECLRKLNPKRFKITQHVTAGSIIMTLRDANTGDSSHVVIANRPNNFAWPWRVA